MPRKAKSESQAMSPLLLEIMASSSALLHTQTRGDKPWLRGDSVTSGMDISPVPNSAPTGLGLDLGIEYAQPEDPEDILLASPHEVRQGRRYLRDVPYLLPSDLAEMHRQSLRTLLGVYVFSSAACSPSIATDPPRKVLELGCGSAFWSSTCHDHFKRLGLPDVSFTGVDVASIAPDLSKQGIRWRFVQHDLRNLPWPFADNEFDFIMVKDMSLAFPQATADLVMEEALRILRDGGTLEMWESDHVLRCLVPHDHSHPVGSNDVKEATANDTKTYLITPDLPFSPALNPFLADANIWIEQACSKWNLSVAPSTTVAEALERTSDLCNIGRQRVAIPFTELPWESERSGGRKRSHASAINVKAHASPRVLTPDQAAIRHTALMTVIQKIESLEPALQEFSGKTADERASWWAALMSNLLDNDGGVTGECLEIGAWWATKRRRKPPA